MFSGHKTLSKMSSISSFMLDIIKRSWSSATLLRFHEHFWDKAFISRGQRQVFPLPHQAKPGICLSVQMYFCLGFYTVWLRSSPWISALRMGRRMTIYEVWGCRLFSSKKHSQVNLGARKGCTVGPPRPMAGAVSLLPTFENPNGKTVFKTFQLLAAV